MYRFCFLYLSSILCCNSPNKHICTKAAFCYRASAQRAICRSPVLVIVKASVCVCVCVCHSLRFCQNDASQNHGVFTISFAKHSLSGSFQKFKRGHPGRGREMRRGKENWRFSTNKSPCLGHSAR